MPSSIHPPNASTDSGPSNSFSWGAFGNLALVFLSLVAGIVLLFQNPQFAMYFEPDNVGWYVKYSQTIFHPDHDARTLYWGESILLPLLGKLLGASKTLASFKVFCCALALSLLPMLAYLSLKTFKHFWQAVLMVAIFAITFVWLREIGIGYPDPLTALLFIIAAFAPHPLVLAAAFALAALSHFSMATVGATTLALMLWFSPILNSREQKKMALSALLGLGFGRLLLQLWYLKFDYLHVTGRVHWFFDRGPQFFLDLYLQNVWGFWTKPGILFLIIYACIVIYFIYKQKFFFAISAILTMGVAYGVMFCTLDGLREFAITIFAGYLYLLRAFVTAIGSKTPKSS